MKQYVVHRAKPGRASQVTHRKTGRFLGLVGQHEAGGGRLAGWWSVWGPCDPGDDGALGEPCTTRDEACEILLYPDYHLPAVWLRRCSRCTNTVPRPPPCRDCEDFRSALTRSIAEQPDRWVHYVWLVQLARSTGSDEIKHLLSARASLEAEHLAGYERNHTSPVPMNDSRPQLSLFETPSASTGHRVVGLFAGIGGFELGLSRAGHSTSMLCEIWDPAVAVLESHFPGVPLVRDVVDLASDVDALPDDVSLLTAGFPCTDLSQAGMMAGIKGENSGLVYQVFRMLHGRSEAGKAIPWLIIENVPNMLHLKRGEAMDVIVTELERLGYRWAYRVVDSRAFGVPQRRRRVFLVASLEGDPRHVVLSDDAGVPKEPKKNDWTGDTTVGFYWTEGVRGVGWAHEAVPTLKGGSTVGVPSSPGLVLKDGRVVKPHIRDAERMQGFEAGWTKPAEKVAKSGYRWKLVGNAVTVDVAAWLGKKLREPVVYDSSADEALPKGSKWPKAAWNVDGKTRMVSSVSEYPEARPRPPMMDFLNHEPELLSYRATRGFLSRATSDKCNLRWPDGFLERLQSHMEAVSQS